MRTSLPLSTRRQHYLSVCCPGREYHVPHLLPVGACAKVNIVVVDLQLRQPFGPSMSDKEAQFLCHCTSL
jgi:hypothetical protein